MEEEISVKDLYRIIKKHLLTILIAMITGILLSVVVMILFITPKYESEAQLLVNQQGDSNQTSIQNNEIQANIQLINTYRDIISGYSVLTQVNDNLNQSYTLSTLEDAVSVTQSTNSQAFKVTVTMETPEEAQTILNEIINVFEMTIKDVYSNTAANIFVLSPASYNINKVSPKLIVFVLIGALIGMGISVLVILITELLDTTVKEDDFLIGLGLINLGHVYESSNKELKQTRLSSQQRSKNTRERI